MTAGDGARALVGDVAVEVGHFAAGQVAGFAHGKPCEREADRVGVQRRGDRRDRGLAADASAFQGQNHAGGDRQDDRSRDDQGQPVALFLLWG